MSTAGVRFWLVWSWRDLRRRWVLVLAIGLLLAGGTGLAAGLGSMQGWRIDSNDRSFGALAAHDLQVEVEEGSFAPEGALAEAARTIPAADLVLADAERLVSPTQIEADGVDTVLTPGRLIGVETEPIRAVDGIEVSGPAVDAISVEDGRGLPADAETAPVAVLDPEYAKENEIELPGTIAIAGGAELELAGLGRSPETFVVLGPGGGFSATRDFGVVFVPLGTAQELVGREGLVNDLALTLREGADPELVAGQLQARLAETLPGLGITVTDLEDLDAHRILYDDAENDQQLFNVFAFLILIGAAFGAFNLVSRTIEAQRREIGIGMALGAPPARLAIRPMMLGLQIAIIGVALGVGVGLLVNAWLSGLLEDQLPLPILETGFRAPTFIRGAVIGFLIPLVAVAWPLRRGLRVTPIEAIRVGFRSARGGGLAPLLRRLPLPGTSMAQMPARNVLRAPRRTTLTVLASAAVVAVAVSMFGMIDSFGETVDRNREAELAGAPDRLTVTLDRFYREDAPQVEAVAGSPAVGDSDRRLSLVSRLRGGEEEIDAVVETLPGAAVWAPALAEGRMPRGAGEILIAASAADDLSVQVGDELELLHPQRTGPNRFDTGLTTVTISGLHEDPLRFPAFVDPAVTAGFGLMGRVNQLDVVPVPGQGSEIETKRALFSIPGIATVEAASTFGDSLEEGLDEFAAVVRVVAVVALLLVLLIAFNSTAINSDERAREYATMFAYGVPVGTVLRLSVVESLIMGVLATILGIGLGIGILNWVVNVSLEEVLPELGMVVSLSAGSVLLAALAGAGAMALAPLLTVRRLRRMDVPSTLRVIE
jgi:putative ABC transport system permease protein